MHMCFYRTQYCMKYLIAFAFPTSSFTMSCEHEHHHHHAAPVPTNAGLSLLHHIDLPHVRALNAENHDNVEKIFRNQDHKYHLKPPVVSDCDSQLILHIPFTSGTVKLHSIILRTNGDKHCPKKIRVWKNDKHIDFDNAASKKATHTIEHPRVGVLYNDPEELPEEIKSDADFVEHHVPRHVFSGVSLLTLFVESVYGEDDEDEEEEPSILHYVELRGEFTALSKDPVVTLYELAPNPADHKVGEVTTATGMSGF